MKRAAVIDPTGWYRYSLYREWDASQPRLGFVMLNPNRADAAIEDPTIRRCIGFAQAWGYGSLEVVNLFAYRVAHPPLLKQALDPIGPDNDAHLLTIGQRVERVILAWGNWGRLYGRDRCVERQLRSLGPLYCLGTTRSGQPLHPLYLRKTIVPQPWVG